MWLYVSQCDYYIMAAHATAAVIAAAAEQVWRLATADTYTNTLLWAWSHVTVTQIAYIKLPRGVELGGGGGMSPPMSKANLRPWDQDRWSWGRWRVS